VPSQAGRQAAEREKWTAEQVAQQSRKCAGSAAHMKALQVSRQAAQQRLAGRAGAGNQQQQLATIAAHAHDSRLGAAFHEAQAATAALPDPSLRGLGCSKVLLNDRAMVRGV
jgi:uncharacterized membrane protein YqiK